MAKPLSALSEPIDWAEKFMASRLFYPWTKDIPAEPQPTPDEGGWIPRPNTQMGRYKKWQAPIFVKGATEFALGVPFFGPLGVQGKATEAAIRVAEQALKEAGVKVTTESLAKQLAKQSPGIAAKNIPRILERAESLIPTERKALPEVGSLAGRISTATGIKEAQLQTIKSLALEKGFLHPNGEFNTPFKSILKSVTGKSNIAKITEEDAGKVIDELAPMVTNMEKMATRAVARQKMLLKPDFKPTASFVRLARSVTGKDTINTMNRDELAAFTDAINNVVIRGGKPPIIPLTKNIITKELAEAIPLFKEIGAWERIRQAPVVFEKINPFLRFNVYEPAEEAGIKIWQGRAILRKQLNELGETIGKSQGSKQRIFRALENPLETHTLDPREQDAFIWFRKFFDDWADKLKLPVDKRRANYITHIFEEAMSQELKAKHPLDPELLRAINFSTPKKVFNPFLKARTGLEMGLKEDPFAAAEAYGAAALKQFNYEPLIQRVRVYQEYLPPIARRYLQDYIKRLVDRPAQLDTEINQSLKELAGKIKELPSGEKVAEIFGMERGNISGMLSHNIASVFYTAFLGFRPAAAVRNLSQQILAVAEVNPANFARGIKLSLTKEGKYAISKSRLLASRGQGFLPGLEESMVKSTVGKAQEYALTLFRAADKFNVSNSFMAGYAEAKGLGLPVEWAIRRGDEVAANTQFIYSKAARSMLEQSSAGRLLAMFTSWPRNFLELMYNWGSGKPSLIYQEYMKETGTKLNLATNPIMKRKQLLMYLSLVGAAYAAETQSNIKWSEYTGWTSLSQLANALNGGLPALDLVGGLANIVVGVTQGSDDMVKAGWNQVRPDRMLMIARNIEDIMTGKRDWLSLFMYLNNTAKPSRSSSSGGAWKRSLK